MSNMPCFPSDKGVYSKRKECASNGNIFFSFKSNQFSEGVSCTEKPASKKGVKNVVSLVEIADKLPNGSIYLNTKRMKRVLLSYVVA